MEYSAVQTNATAQPVIPRIAFDKAAVVVALDSDFLGLDRSTVLPVKEFVRGGRKITDEAIRSMNRLVCGGAAVLGNRRGGRPPVPSEGSEIGAFASALLNAVQSQANPLKVVGQGSRRPRRR